MSKWIERYRAKGLSRAQRQQEIDQSKREQEEKRLTIEELKQTLQEMMPSRLPSFVQRALDELAKNGFTCTEMMVDFNSGANIPDEIGSQYTEVIPGHSLDKWSENSYGELDYHGKYYKGFSGAIEVRTPLGKTVTVIYLLPIVRRSIFGGSRKVSSANDISKIVFVPTVPSGLVKVLTRWNVKQVLGEEIKRYYERGGR